MKNKGKRIAFVVGVFPATSMTFIIDQVAGLLDRGFDVDIYSFKRGDPQYVSDRYIEYNMAKRTKYIGMPDSGIERVFRAIPKIVRLVFVSPSTLFRALNIRKYNRDALSLKLLFWSEPFVRTKRYDLIHIHEGTTANQFLHIKDIVGIKTKILTSLLGQDISRRVAENPGRDIYKRLKDESHAFIVMSNNMKERVIAQGFDENKLYVLPISVNIKSYPFKKRAVHSGQDIQMVSVGRFVEKKGFDDLLRALAIVKEKTNKKFTCSIIGGGRLENNLHTMTKDLNLEDVVSYKGYMKMEDIINYFKSMHFYLQPSKTAPDGDME